MLIIVDNTNKVIRPIDLKTSSHAEWDFYQSFVTWNYAIQARLYWRLIRETLNRYPQFQNYKLLDYIFIVANKKTLVPLVWEFKDTQTYGTLVYGKNKNIVCRDPFDLGGELRQYLHDRPKVPNKILLNGRNNIVEWLNKEL